MSGISSSTGLISGLNTGQIIDQLIAVEARPRDLAQQRVTDLQTQQAAFLGLVSKLGALKSTAQNFRLNNVFQLGTAASSDSTVLTATASAGAIEGSYSFLVDRTVTTQQALSRGFTDRSTTSTGLTSVVVETAQARLDSDTELSQLNGGDGVSRGKVIVTDSSGASTTIDLSRAATVSDVISAFNSSTAVKVQASVEGGQFIISDKAGGGGTLRISSAAGYTTAESLGIAKSAVSGAITGDSVYSIGDDTTIQSLNDGNGIRFNTAAGTATNDFAITTSDGSTYQIDIGDTYDGASKKTAGPVGTIADLRARVKAQTGNKVDVQVRADGRGLTLVDSSGGAGTFQVTDLSGAATDLGIVGTGVAGVITGSTKLAGLNSVLASSLNGGAGVSSGAFTVATRDGLHNLSFSVDVSQSVSTIIKQINDAGGGYVTAALNANGNGIVLTDTTSGSGNFVVGGAGATALGLANGAGVASNTATGSRIGRQYITQSTLLSTLNGGTGIGTGTFQIIGPTGKSGSVVISSSAVTVGDVLAQINGTTTATGVRARIDDTGTGIIVEKDPSSTGTQTISIKDVSGTVARALNLAGDAADNTTHNYVDGSYRRTITVNAADTLDTVVGEINGARAGISASVISDGSAVNPFHLKVAASQAGRDGRVIVETTGTDLNLSTIAQGEDARVFVGSDDPARAILITRSSNAVEGVIDGVRVDLKNAGANPVTVTVTRDTDSIDKAVNDFVSAFNDLSSQISTLTSYNPDTNQRGTLLGDTTVNALRSQLFSILNQTAPGVSGRYQFLSQVGITVGTGGQLQFDSSKLHTALDTDSQSVADLFAAHTAQDNLSTVPIPGVPGASVNNTSSGTYTALGVAEVLGQMVDKYTDSTTGILTNRNQGFNDQIKLQNDRITDLNKLLDDKRSQLETQFAQLEQTLAQLQSQQKSLGSIGTATG